MPIERKAVTVGTSRNAREKKDDGPRKKKARKKYIKKKKESLASSVGTVQHLAVDGKPAETLRMSFRNTESVVERSPVPFSLLNCPSSSSRDTWVVMDDASI